MLEHTASPSKHPWLPTLSSSSPWQAGLWLAACCALLNFNVNSTFPAAADLSRAVLPSWETLALLLVCAFWVGFGKRVSPTARSALVLLLLLARLFRLVDGCYERFFNRPFRVLVDLPLLPESVHLLVATDGVAATALQLSLLVLALALWVWVLKRALELLESSMRALLRSNTHTSLALSCAVLIPATASLSEQSLSARIAEEVRFTLDYPEMRRDFFARLDQRGQRFAHGSHDLRRLEGRDVAMILIESYGRGALETPTLTAKMDAALAQLEQRLTAGGRQVVSRWLLPPTFGGGSWFAHATLTTGVKVWTPDDYNLLLSSTITPLSKHMRAAGYHTVNVMPGTTRVWPQETFFGFDERFYGMHMEYSGPTFSWGRFPDQWVLDQVRLRYPSGGTTPTYKEVKLVSSHVPWSSLPATVADWDQLGNGTIYEQLPRRRFDVKWSRLDNAHEPYVESILYDMDVVGEYVRRFEPEDALILVLGDHQPVKEAAGSERWEVPLHIAGPPALVARFAERGFAPSMLPGAADPLPMEEFLGVFLNAVSVDSSAVSD